MQAGQVVQAFEAPLSQGGLAEDRNASGRDPEVNKVVALHAEP